MVDHQENTRWDDVVGFHGEIDIVVFERSVRGWDGDVAANLNVLR